MANYVLQPNEAIILKNTGVRHESSGGHTDEIMLTNQNFVWTSITGFFSFSKEIYQYPLNQIKVFNGRAQALLGKSRHGSPILEVYFANGMEESFGFNTISSKEAKKEIRKWIKAINLAVTGNELDDDEDKDEIGHDDSLLGVFREFGAELKEAFIGPSNIAKSMTPEKIARKCASCGAPVSGKKGQTVHCEYCGVSQQL